MKVQGEADTLAFLFHNINRMSTNSLVLIFGTILLIFVGALTSIVLFTYQNTIKIVEDSQTNILINKKLNEQIAAHTENIPLQNREILRNLTALVRQVNMSIQELSTNQKLLIQHINATTDYLGTASHITTPQLRNALYAVAASNPTVTKDSFTTQLDELLADLNQSTTIIEDLQQQVRNLSTQIPQNESEDIIEQEFGSNSAFPFAQNRVERAETPENESMLKEPEGGTIAGFPPQK